MKNTNAFRQGHLCSLSLVLGIFFSGNAGAWDGVTSGKITSLEITSGANFAYRVYLNGGTQAMCTGGPSFAYLNEADSNYKTYVANLMLAKAQGVSVTLYTTTESGFCHIGHVAIGS